jgi:hypothetical protein
MNQAKLIKMAPTVFMVAILGYLAYSVHGGLDEPAAPGAIDTSLSSAISQVEKEVNALESAIVSSASAVRDPFRTVASGAEQSKAETTKDAPEKVVDTTDRIAEILKGMSLDATFVQGSEQIAIIDGKMYHRGQRLPLPDSDGEASSPLLIAVVHKDKVFFRGVNKTYSLGYPEHLGGLRHPKPGENEAGVEAEMAEIDPAGELEFYKSLLNSPLGKMGKGLTGSMGIKLPPSASNRPQPRDQ